VDTGAVPSVLDTRIARKLHLRGRSERVDVPNQTLATERVTVPDVVVGPSPVAELSVIVRDLSLAEEALGTKIDAMIGFDMLGQLAFTIDYETRKLTFGPIDPSFVTVPYSPALTYALVPLHVQQETLAILVDTGASNLVLFQSGIRNCRSSVDIVGRETWTGMGGEMPVAKARLLNAYLGEEAWGQRMAYVLENSANQSSEVEGLLGTVALGRRVAFDPVRRVVGWEPK
jgi:Aspartyl protease